MFHGLYINLDRRRDRRAHMEREFARFGLAGNYRRIAAVPDADPAASCYRSHMKALEEARRIGGIVHIVEDDSILSPQLAPFLEGQAKELLTRYDLLFLDMWVDQNRDSIDSYQRALDEGVGVIPVTANGPRIAATSSYLAAPARIGKLHRLLRRSAAAGLPIDGVYELLVRSGECTAAIAIPFLTGVDLKYGSTSDIQSISPRDQSMFVLLRTRFFVDRDRQS